MTISTRLVVACVVLASATVLSACAETQQKPRVASLTTAGSTPTSARNAGDQGQRPQLRMDSSKADIDAAWASYDVCLKDHGHVMLQGNGLDAHAGEAAPPGQLPDMNDNSPKSLAARQACQNRLPLQPPEMSQTTNPRYLDQYHVYMTCLTKHDLAVHAIDPFGTGWTYDDGVTPKLTDRQAEQVDHDCQLSSFSLK
jgi:hypothetical protein